MILDGHIHISSRLKDTSGFGPRLTRAGVGGGIVISVAPPAFPAFADATPAKARLDQVFAVAKTAPRARLFPFFWIDPMESDAVEQVDEAVKRGIAGFKVICHAYYPGDPKAMAVYRRIAEHGKPILFHSGILADGRPSSHFSRPVEFECLIDVEGVRFALAHLGWPWTDELIAVYGKFLDTRLCRPEVKAEMFIDTTPGTPRIYRHDVFVRLFGCGYDAANNVFFGSDRGVNNYDVKGVRELVEFDNWLCDEIGLDAETQRNIFVDNLLRFVGATA